MKRNCIFILSLFPLLAFCQSYGKVDENTLKKVVNIESNGFTGTGFLVYKRSEIDTARGKVFLVTNKHIIGKWSLVDTFISNQTMTFFLYTNDSLNPNQSVPIKITGFDRKISNDIRLHSDPKIDIVAIDVTKEIGESRNLDVDYFHFSYLIPISKISSRAYTGIGDEVYAIGYPDGITSVKTNRPIVKAGIIASDLTGNLEVYTNVKNRKDKVIFTVAVGKYFLVDGLIIGGNSGGPIVLPKEVKIKRENGVFMSTTEAIPNLVLGIVSSRVGNTGISFIYSCDHIIEVIESFGKY